MFQFKKFKIEDSECAMKVCTDSCILGSYTEFENPKRILDIGAGSGLISIMLAQRFLNSEIVAIEIDEKASVQCKDNFLNSPWHSRLVVENQDIKFFTALIKFDLIVSNPPFYENFLKSENHIKNIAHHADELSYEQLLQKVSELIAENGIFSVLIPNQTSDKLVKIALEKGLFLCHQLDIYTSEDGKCIRNILYFSPYNQGFTQKELAIKKSKHNQEYTAEFEQLLKDYYLIF